ncbi:TlpA family protein disulfide reductase [Thiocapsa bogorovii]|uniref:TlpA family protein disulfide reductase n=1 Tax=Thiocapsa bogorovii TaxID=521689 RepID=UPI001E5C9B29|nr:TlpA disulfide reductase family protein [Thiocapsa bogorovii]UHD18408.1 TlpA family protein disulfide reductase [Thiocapsa bogorovii]
MSAIRVGMVILLAGGISVGVAIVGQRWIGAPKPDSGLPARQSAPLQTLPDFGLTDLAGSKVSSEAWAGKVVVINYWASWCPPCVREMPLFIETQEALGEAGVQVVGIAVDRPEDVEAFVAQYPVNYPILVANPEAVALSKRLGNRVEGLPFTVIFDRRGRRVFSRTGEVTAAELKAELGALVDAEGSAESDEDAS